MPKISQRSVDKAIGGRLKFYRKRANLSQTALGNQLDVSFQQVQKYESGINRISAACMMKIVQVLGISMDHLLLSHVKGRAGHNEVVRFAMSAEGRKLVHGFLAIKDPYMRRQIVGLIRALSPRKG